MKQKLPLFASLLLMALFIWTACTRSSPFGSDLLDDQLADYDFTDTLSIRCTIEAEDSLITSDRASTAGYFLCGALDDPYFGKTTADIYTLFQPGVPTSLNKTTLQFDSIVLFVRYGGGTGLYGDTTLAQTLTVHRVDEGSLIGLNSTYYSSQSLPATTEVGRYNNLLPKPSRLDSLFSVTNRGAYIRLRLNDDFGRELMSYDSTTLVIDSSFYKKLRGLKISCSSGAGTGLVLPLNLNDENFSRIRLYYTDLAGDTTSRTFDYFFQGSNKFSSFKHDYGTSAAGQQIGLEANELLYLQGAEGLKVKVEIPYVDRLENIAVNKADLIFAVNSTLPNENVLFKPANQFVFSRLVADTTYDLISDVYNSVNASGAYTDFGGAPNKEVDGITRYHHNLSDYLQELVDLPSGSDIKKKTIYLNVNLQSRTAMRSILYGPKSTIFPAKLELKYTRTK
ncbi:MAG: DUF4270 family protein [Saprospiraceae bacterium]|nr:DUF4270 family protein [Saprospiraceae bacterium]